MSIKRKHTTLTLEKKCEILKHLDEGRSISELSRMYKLGKSTVSDIKRKKNQILNFVVSTNRGPGKRMTLKGSGNPNVESAVYAWFIQERSQRTPITGDMLCEKAKYFYKEITGKDDFKASSGWLDRFKRRHGIRLLIISGEQPSLDEAAVAPFEHVFVDKINEMGVEPNQITKEEPIEDAQDSEDQIEVGEEEEEVTSSLVKHKVAVNAFETCLKWSSENNVPVYQILLLRQLQEEAFKAHIEELK